MVYIRKFSTNGAKMTLVNTLQGHEGEVTCVRWNIHGKGSWVTGSEDGTIRIWVSVLINNINVVIITICLSGCPSEIYEQSISFPLAQASLYFTHGVPLSKGTALIVNHVSRSKVKVKAELYEKFLS